MKVKKVVDGIWEVYDNNIVVAEIQTFWRYGKSDGKMLYIGDKEICEVKNQKEAIDKVQEHLDKLK